MKIKVLFSMQLSFLAHNLHAKIKVDVTQTPSITSTSRQEASLYGN